ncbi:zinc-ribbon and DUF3426 domain-containing protein [Isoalcanivorax indicus]|uniref:zinc-ribbon and DUF3426 domain-containing protein n=1 Tax=Isoalcanivorax indicus TaxID=2202653 RepID=UPI000DB9AF49|nr:zinc-ribbon and DUF3426 domain-containing protein [Isoalcanivorax indicus]
MATQYKTQCPHCGAQFKIGEQHLRQARGAVRCGSCLQVFQATDHLIEAPAPTAAPAAPSPASPPARKKRATDDESWAEDLLASETPPPAPAPPQAPARQWTLDDDAPPAAAAPGESKPSLDDDRNDTRVSLGGRLELSDSFLSLDEDSADGLGDEDFSDMSGAGRSTQGQGSDESWAEALLQELEEEDAPPPPPRSAAEMRLDGDTPPSRQRASKARAKKEDDLFEDNFDLFGGSGDDDLDALALEELDEPPVRKAPRGEPLFARERLDIGQAIKWTTLSLAALLVLTTQYLVFNHDRLARTPQWRPLYATACDLFGCSLPNPSDVRTLRGANLVVRSHPDVADALVVDAILFNHADYEQPFPILELSFSSLRGQPVASRRFLPQEYLRGELLGMQTMPRDVPIRVSFEIMNPGEQAENYRLYFHPNNGQANHPGA